MASSGEFACIRAELLYCHAHVVAIATDKPLSHLNIVLGVRCL